MPGPLLKDRIFTVLAVSGIPAADADAGKQSFLTVTLPIDLGAVKPIETAKYASSKDLVHAVYSSVEYVYATDGGIAWEMATASDAKGALPMSVQKLGITGAIVKDVGLFLSWVNQKRSS